MLEVKFKEFVDIVKRLRKECPWDKEQTNESIKAATLEEAYEAVHAIDEHDYDELKKELGDLLFHVAFHTAIAEDDNKFTFEEVINSISEKLIRRHPHVFGDVKVSGNEEIMKNWEMIKLQEGRKSILEGVPQAMPALMRAHRLQEKASKVGFDWDNIADVKKKVNEELDELQRELESNELEKAEEEFGDLLFSLINLSRFLNINPETALRKTTGKFERRFGFIEKKLEGQNKKITDVTLEEMDRYWDESKKFEK